MRVAALVVGIIGFLWVVVAAVLGQAGLAAQGDDRMYGFGVLIAQALVGLLGAGLTMGYPRAAGFLLATAGTLGAITTLLMTANLVVMVGSLDPFWRFGTPGMLVGHLVVGAPFLIAAVLSFLASGKANPSPLPRSDPAQ